MNALTTQHERELTEQAAELLVAELSLHRDLGAWARTLMPSVVAETSAWSTGSLAYINASTRCVGARGSEARRALCARLDAERHAWAVQARGAWQVVQVRQALPDGGALVLLAADDWAGNDSPRGVTVHLDRYAASGAHRSRWTVADCALAELAWRIGLVAACGVGDFLAAVPAELAAR